MVMLRTMAIVSVPLLNLRTDVPLLRRGGLDSGRGLIRRTHMLSEISASSPLVMSP